MRMINRSSNYQGSDAGQSCCLSNIWIMKKKNIPCADCCMRRKYEANPRSLVSRFWHWHTRFCPGWKAFMKSLSEEEREKMRIKYDLK